MTVNSMCKPQDESGLLKEIAVDDSDACDVKISFTSKYGCPLFEATPIIAFFGNNPWIVGTLLIVFGVVSAFFGGKLFPKVLVAAFAGAAFLVVVLVLSAIGAMNALNGAKSGGAIAMTVVSFIIALAAAVFAGWFIHKIKRIAFMAVGGLAGFVVGFLLYTILFVQLYQAVWLYVTLLIVGVALGAFLVYKYDKTIIVYLTAFLGAYALVRGISVFAGGYINEMTLFGQITSGTFDAAAFPW